MNFIITTAPAVYDYGSTAQITGAVTLANMTDDFLDIFEDGTSDIRYMLSAPRPDAIRIVAIMNPSDARYQLRRYQSGSYLALLGKLDH